MRLWHEALIPYLPQMQLRGQHSECCALRGKGWGSKQSTVCYVRNYPYARLFRFHHLVMSEIEKRGGVKIDPVWHNPQWRGKQLKIDASAFTAYEEPVCGYPEHDITYYNECLCNLMGETKGKVAVYPDGYNGHTLRFFTDPFAWDGDVAKLRCAEFGQWHLIRREVNYSLPTKGKGR